VTNQLLRDALNKASMTTRDLATRLDVDEKTTARWVADEGRVPHPQHRWAAAKVLGVDEAVLWPEAVKTALKTGPDREVVSVYPFRSVVPKSLWRDLISNSTTEITFAGYTNYFLWLEMPNLRTTLRRKADQGVRVRFLIGDPDSAVTTGRESVEDVPLTVSTRIRVTLDEFAKLRDQASVEGRFSDGHISLSVFRFDDDALVCTHIADLLGHDSPTFHLRRRQDDGIFDRFTHHVEHLWERGREV
jgi:transcriptional regulator with XRE-family HTH domain